MVTKNFISIEIIESVSAAFDEALEQSLAKVVEKNNSESLSRGGYSIAYFNEFVTNASRFFRQELGLEERAPDDYRGNEPRPRTKSALLELLKKAEHGLGRSLGKSDGPTGGFIGEDAIADAIRTAREEAERQIEQKLARPKKRPFRLPEEVAARKADAFAKRVTRDTTQNSTDTHER